MMYWSWYHWPEGLIIRSLINSTVTMIWLSLFHTGVWQSLLQICPNTPLPLIQFGPNPQSLKYMNWSPGLLLFSWYGHHLVLPGEWWIEVYFLTVQAALQQIEHSPLKKLTLLSSIINKMLGYVLSVVGELTLMLERGQTPSSPSWHMVQDNQPPDLGEVLHSANMNCVNAPITKWES